MVRDVETYFGNYTGAYGFECEIVHYRQTVIVERLRALRPNRILEIGCGIDVLPEIAAAAGITWESWTIVEADQRFADFARKAKAPNLTIVPGFLEEVTDRIPGPYDYIICASLLQEAPSAEAMLAALRGRMGSASRLHINVPSTTSLHRRLARSMGLINDLSTFSDRNRRLQHHRVFDMASLRNLVEQNGFRVSLTGGHSVKPFTHDQMAAISESLWRDVLDGLFELGKEMPDIASEIHVEVCRPDQMENQK